MILLPPMRLRGCRHLQVMMAVRMSHSSGMTLVFRRPVSNLAPERDSAKGWERGLALGSAWDWEMGMVG